MSLVKLNYFQNKNKPHSWEISEATFSAINLMVGKNATGKSRVVAIIHNFAQCLAKGIVFGDSFSYEVELKLNQRHFSYQIAFESGAVVLEVLKINGDEKLNRGNDGSGKIFYEKEQRFFDFKLPINAIAAFNRLDEVQHSFLIELNEWAKSVILYQFGSDFGKTQLMDVNDVHHFANNPNVLFDDPNNLVMVYVSAFSKFNDKFDQSIIKDMCSLGYSITEVGSDNLQSMVSFPIPAMGMFVMEKDLRKKTPQTEMSQGMFRALALVIHLNVCAFAKNKQLILVDDIGEGLDYERAVQIIDLLINKAEEYGLQLIMTSNDRFVMNKVPLEYWSVLKRKGGVVKMFNKQNSPKQFDDFKYLGLNNFDFFASDFFEAEIADD